MTIEDLRQVADKLFKLALLFPLEELGFMLSPGPAASTRKYQA